MVIPGRTAGSRSARQRESGQRLPQAAAVTPWLLLAPSSRSYRRQRFKEQKRAPRPGGKKKPCWVAVVQTGRLFPRAGARMSESEGATPGTPPEASNPVPGLPLRPNSWLFLIPDVQRPLGRCALNTAGMGTAWDCVDVRVFWVRRGGCIC